MTKEELKEFILPLGYIEGTYYHHKYDHELNVYVWYKRIYKTLQLEIKLTEIRQRNSNTNIVEISFEAAADNINYSVSAFYLNKEILANYNFLEEKLIDIWAKIYA